MIRPGVRCGLLVAALASAAPSMAQPATRPATVGLLCVGDCPAPPLEANLPTFLTGLGEAGFVDGQNLVVDLRGIGDTPAQLPMLMARLIRRPVDVIVAMGAAAALAAKQASTTIPIVILDVPNALELGLVASLARPGGNVTGVDRAGALLLVEDTPLSRLRTRITSFGLERRIPVMAWSRQFPAAGGLVSYGPSRAEMHQLAAAVVAKILQGRRPADIPVEQPTRYPLVVNLSTAKAIGVTLPPAVLAGADEVIR